MNKKVKILIGVGVIVCLIICGVCICNSIRNKTNNVGNTEVNLIDNNLIKNEDEIDNFVALEDLPQDYSIEQAIKDNCVVSGTEFYNKNKLDEFIEDVSNNKESFMRCITFTVEGDMLITDIEFEGNNSFKVAFDWTRDEYSSSSDRIIRYCRYEKFEKEDNSYYVDSPVEGDLGKMYIIGYDED